MDTKTKIDLKMKHLDYIQGAISRMAASSATQKNYCITILTALVGAFLITKTNELLYLAAFSALVFGYLDARYLQSEKGFRKLYDKVRSGEAECAPNFSMTPLSSSFWRSVTSWSIWPFYSGLIIGVGFLIWVLCKP
ncbi:MAG: hypothetical protein OIF58_09495 [Cohaesibacter sp.]|nr:hypothetical protein [Cohaesibacter sp.]